MTAKRSNSWCCFLLLGALVFVLPIQGIKSSHGFQLPNWTRITLSNGISFRLPTHWKILSKRKTEALDAEARSKISHIYSISSELPFAANEMDDGRTVALLNIRVYPLIEISQDEVRMLAQVGLNEYDSELKKMIRISSEIVGFELRSWLGTKSRLVGDTLALETRYKRVSMTGKGVFFVRLVRIIDGPKSFTLTVSYLESRDETSQSVIEHIVNSLQTSN